jgi:hypothetical protein
MAIALLGRKTKTRNRLKAVGIPSVTLARSQNNHTAAPKLRTLSNLIVETKTLDMNNAKAEPSTR